MKISELKPLEKNPFKSKGDKQIEAIGKSIKEFSEMMYLRPIIIDEDMNILGGNKRYFALKMLGYKDIPDNWVKMATDLSEEQKKEFIVKDNAHWGSEWDFDMLKDWNVDLEDFGVSGSFEVDFSLNDEEAENIYTKKIEPPIYEIQGKKPELKELFDDSITKDLIKKIEQSSLDSSVKEFLIASAYRFVKFNYENIAEYYAHSDKDVKNLMEELALVIIDYEKAVELGFINLTEELANEFVNSIKK